MEKDSVDTIDDVSKNSSNADDKFGYDLAGGEMPKPDNSPE